MSSPRETDEVAAARRSLSGYKQDAAILLANWPTEERGSLPFSGPYVADPKSADFIYSVGDIEASDPMAWIGSYIWKVANGGVRFDLDSVRTKVEYHPADQVPASFVTRVRGGNVEQIMQRYVLLEPNWFFAWYSVREL